MSYSSAVSQTEGSESTSRTLLHRVQQQEAAAWERFTRLYGPLVYRWCVSGGLKPHDSADVMQEVFQAVFQGVAKFQRQSAGQSLRGWLWTITRNKICDHFRKQANQPLADGGTAAYRQFDELAVLPEANAEPVAAHVAELSHRVLTLIQTEFAPSTWQAFWAMAVDGLSAAETATQLGLTTAAAFKAKSRVLNRLRTELDGLLE
jgi:RNA polymerase sigma-70 factor (ECF subfamily)